MTRADLPFGQRRKRAVDFALVASVGNLDPKSKLHVQRPARRPI